jgi:ribose/xylose/arabinose/galactoside ABC-type transport system permease subunit
LTASALLPDFGFLNASVTGLSLPLRDDLRSSALLSVIVVVASAFALNVSNLPRQAKAVGANRDSAAYAGVNYRKVLYLTYGINGAFAGTAGVLFALLNSSASTVDLQGRELIAIATAVLGGTVMTGGYLNLWSISMAAALWKLMELTIFGVRVSVFPDFQQRIITVLFACAILVLAYVSARLEKNLFVQGLLEPKHSQSRNRRSRNE